MVYIFLSILASSKRSVAWCSAPKIAHKKYQCAAFSLSSHVFQWPFSTQNCFVLCALSLRNKIYLNYRLGVDHAFRNI